MYTYRLTFLTMPLRFEVFEDQHCLAYCKINRPHPTVYFTWEDNGIGLRTYKGSDKVVQIRKWAKPQHNFQNFIKHLLTVIRTEPDRHDEVLESYLQPVKLAVTEPR